MRPRSALLLLGLGVVVLALGLFYGAGLRGRTDAPPSPALAFPGLAGKLATAVEIKLVQHGTAVILSRPSTAPDAVWGVASAAGYPAQPAKVRALLTGLTELRLDERRTADPAEYARLGVEDPQVPTAHSTLLNVLDLHGGVLAALVVGHARTGAQGGAETLYVRRPDAAGSWLADGRLPVEADAQAWLDRDIMNIPAAQVASVVATRDGAALTIARQGETWALTAPAEHPKLDQFKLDEVGRALEGLTLTAVQKAPAPGAPLGHSVFTTTDGRTITANVSKAGENVWATFTAAGRGDAAALAARMQPWAYRLDAWKQQALTPTLDDLKVAEPPSPAPAPK